MKDKGNTTASFLNIALIVCETNAGEKKNKKKSICISTKTKYFLYTVEKKCRDDRTFDLKPIFLCDFLLLAAGLEPKLD